MKIRESEFWIAIKQLMRADNHVPVPDECVARALAIFQPLERPERSFLFQLRPAFTGMVRRASGASKKFYELGDRVVQLELTHGDDGVHLTGFAHGFNDIPVTLHGQEVVFQTELDGGAFTFDALPVGTYSMSFSQDGEDYWITGLQINE